MSLPTVLEDITGALLDGGSEAIPLAFMCAARRLAVVTKDALLFGRGAPPALAALAPWVGAIDHLGFIAPETPDDELAAAASAAGFAQRWWTFPSTVLALELGARIGRATVPTRVFKATGRAGTVEVFLPAEVPPPIVHAWITAGIGSHFALPLHRAQDFPRASAILARAGFIRPPGLGGDPASNPRERILVSYFDGSIGERALRLELCHATPTLIDPPRAKGSSRCR